MKAQSSLVSSDTSQAMLASSKQEARFAGGTTSRSMNGSDTDRLPSGAKVHHQGTLLNDSDVTKAARDSVESRVNRIMHPQVGDGGGLNVTSWADLKDDADYPTNIDEIPEDWEEQYHKDFPTPGGQDWPQQPNPPDSNTGPKGHSGSSSSHAAAAGAQGAIIPNFVSGPSVSPGFGSGFKFQSNTDSKEDAPVNQIFNALDTSSKPALLNGFEKSLKNTLRPTGQIIDSPRNQVIGTSIGTLSGGNAVIYPSKPSKNKAGPRLVTKDQLLQAPTSTKTVNSYVAVSDPRSGPSKVCGCKAVPFLGLSKKRPNKDNVHTVIDGNSYKQSSKFSLQKPAGWDGSSTVFNNVVKGSSSKRPRNHVVSVASVSVNGGRTYNTLAYKEV